MVIQAYLFLTQKLNKAGAAEPVENKTEPVLISPGQSGEKCKTSLAQPAPSQPITVGHPAPPPLQLMGHPQIMGNPQVPGNAQLVGSHPMGFPPQPIRFQPGICQQIPLRPISQNSVQIPTPASAQGK